MNEATPKDKTKDTSADVHVSYDVDGQKVERKRQGWLRNETLRPMDLSCKDLPSRLTTARKRAGLTQKDLTSTLGVNRTAIAQWETGLTWPSLVKIEELANALKVSPEWIAFGAGQGINTSEEQRESSVTEVVFEKDDGTLKARTKRMWSIPEIFLRQYTTNKVEAVVLTKVTSDALRPFKTDSLVILDTSVKSVGTTGHYMIVFHDEPVIAHIAVGFDDNAKVTMHTGQPIDAPLEKVEVIGKVMGVVGSIPA